METEILEKKLQDAQMRLAEKDGDKEKEIQGLKRLISELEFQLTMEKSNSESFLDKLRKEIKHKSDELEKLTQEKTQLIHSLSQVQEEVGTAPRKCLVIFACRHVISKIIQRFGFLTRTSIETPRLLKQIHHHFLNTVDHKRCEVLIQQMLKLVFGRKIYLFFRSCKAFLSL